MELKTLYCFLIWLLNYLERQQMLSTPHAFKVSSQAKHLPRFQVSLSLQLFHHSVISLIFPRTIHTPTVDDTNIVIFQLVLKGVWGCVHPIPTVSVHMINQPFPILLFNILIIYILSWVFSKQICQIIFIS